MKQAVYRRRQILPLLHVSGLALMIALAAIATSARADDTAAMALAEQEAEEKLAARPLQVGEATEGLLAWQRSGEIASPTPRPIPGTIAFRSYERYLKSFEHPIPEYLNSSVKKAPGSSGQ